MYFLDRREAGEQLAKRLIHLKDKDVVVYALPRGGVVCAEPVARYLKAPLELVITRKIGHPQSSEYAIGAVSEHGRLELSQEADTIDESWLRHEVERQVLEAKRRRNTYTAERKKISCENKIAIIIDDGLATGLTMKVAIHDIRALGPQQLIVVVPVAPQDTAREISKLADEFICLHIESTFFSAVGAYYKHFEQTSDEDVMNILKKFQ